MSNYDWVFWLNVTNIALGVLVILAVALLAYGVVWELIARRRRHGVPDVNAEMNAMLHDQFSHTLAVPELGLTMADGGEHVKPTTPATPTKPEEKKSK
jgi:hypothetical protein